MTPKSFARVHESGCALTIDASPGASRSEIVGVNRWRGALRVKIAAAAREGEANEELVRFLAERFSIPRKSIKILSGGRSSIKTIFVPLTAERVAAILEES
jgi:uncharacterized protein (TIGR00251 family)